MMHFLDEIDARARAQARRVSARASGRARRLAALPRRGVRSQLQRQGLLRAQARRRRARRRRTCGARARAILEHGGAARANVFTRITLAMFQQVPWRGVPYIPVEIMLLPRWSPFHLDKVSYWSRTVMVPLLVLCTRRAAARNPRAVHIRELFTVPPEQEQHYFRRGGRINHLFLLLDRVGRSLDAVGAAVRAPTRRAARRALDPRASQR